jgi:dihydropteroate synthase
MLTASPAPIAIRGQVLAFGQRTYVMGIINVTPDSFSGDGLLASSGAPVSRAVEQARQMVAEGADILDIGGESTRPDHDRVAEDEELARVDAVVAAVRAALPTTPLSIDTRKPHVAIAALEAGADIINDVSSVIEGAALASIAAQHSVPYVLMHDRAEPVYVDTIREVVEDLRAAMGAAIAAGCAPESLIVDPGIGFGKTAGQNLVLLDQLGALRALERPILLGTSRKSTIGRVLGLPPEQRLEGTLATTALGIAQGVDIVRVHDVEANVRVARMSDAIVRRGWHDPA